MLAAGIELIVLILGNSFFLYDVNWWRAIEATAELYEALSNSSLLTLNGSITVYDRMIIFLFESESGSKPSPNTTEGDDIKTFPSF